MYNNHRDHSPSKIDDKNPIAQLSVDVSHDSSDSSPQSPLDVATPLTEDGMTALHLAAQGNNYQSVPMLIQCGSSVYAEDDEGRTPLYIALLYGCTLSASILLQYMDDLEHTTKSGNNFLHAAIKSGEISCLLTLLKIIPSGMIWHLAMTPDHTGITPFALALLSKDTLKLLQEFGFEVKEAIAHRRDLIKLVGPECFEILGLNDEICRCKVYMQGAPIADEKLMKWTIGCLLISKQTTWKDFTSNLSSILSQHWKSLCFCNNTINEENHMNGNVCENRLELSISSVQSFQIGSFSWKLDHTDLDKMPYEVLLDNCDSETTPCVTVILNQVETLAYTCLIPVSLVQNYMRLVEQSKCIVIYGAKCSGKTTIMRLLTSLYSKNFTRLCVQEPLDGIYDTVEQNLLEGVVLLERVPRECWPKLVHLLKNSKGKLLATMDSWRRPPGQLETDVVWVQLRHDREPLNSYICRWATRYIVDKTGSPNWAHMEKFVFDGWRETIKWIEQAYRQLSDILMSLGFSEVLRGPNLFTNKIQSTHNCRDILIKMNELWWEELAPAICCEVDRFWRQNSSHIYDKNRISAMAIHVIQQKVFLSSMPHCATLYPKLIETHPALPPRPKNLHITPSKKEDKTPMSPEWTQDNLTRILGLSPMGYS